MPEQMMHYTIRVREHLIPEQWETWFSGLTLEILPGGEMQLSGPVSDQAALHGILTRIRDLGLTLVYLSADKIDVPTFERSNVGTFSRRLRC